MSDGAKTGGYGVATCSALFSVRPSEFSTATATMVIGRQLAWPTPVTNRPDCGTRSMWPMQTRTSSLPQSKMLMRRSRPSRQGTSKYDSPLMSMTAPKCVRVWAGEEPPRAWCLRQTGRKCCARSPLSNPGSSRQCRCWAESCKSRVLPATRQWHLNLRRS